MCGTRTASSRNPAVEEVAVIIPFPKSVQSVSLSANVGNVHYDEITKVCGCKLIDLFVYLFGQTCRWTIGTIPKTTTPQLSGSIVLLPHEKPPESNPSLSVNFKLNQFTLSGYVEEIMQGIHGLLWLV